MKDQASGNKRQRNASSSRALAISLRIGRALLVPVLCIVALFVGLWLGYSYLGGQSADEVWNWSTWKHLFDLVFAS